MAYAHFEDHDEVIVSTRLGTNPQELTDFILGSVVKTHAERHLAVLDSPRSHGDEESRRLIEETARVDLGPLEASRAALDILRQSTELVQRHIRSLELLVERGEGGGGTMANSTPEIMKRFAAVTSRPSSQGAPPTVTTERLGHPGPGGGRGRYGSVDSKNVDT